MNNAPRDTSRDVSVGMATVVYCKYLEGYPLPGHSAERPRMVKSESKALGYAMKINVEMGKG
jgi:hypothetical protein